MATHDYVLANQSGAAFRTDLNNALAAIVSNNSNSSEPATMYAYQWWADTSANILKLRNSANNAWISICNLDGTIIADRVVTASIADDAIVQALIANDAVGADELASDAVVNASVASDAAIAGSKISPDFGSQNITTTGTVNAPSIGSGQIGNRNLIINGGITVSQRKGTTETTVPHDTSFYTVDRFAVFDKIDGGDNFTYQQTTNPVPDGFSHALKINTAIADTSISADNYAFFYQIVEGQNIQQANLGTSAAKQLTLSFHVYSNKTGTYTVGLVNQGTFDRTFLKEFTISSSATWEKKTITFPAITDGTWNDVRVQWALAAGSNFQGAADTLLTSVEIGTSNQVNLASAVNNSFHITGIQLEVSTIATDFEHRSFGHELALCQRYAYIITGDDNDYTGFSGYSTSTSAAMFPVFFPVTMRAAPSFTFSGSARFQGGTNDSATFTSGLAIINPNTNGTGAVVQLTGSSGMGAADRPGNLQLKASGSSLLFIAEL